MWTSRMCANDLTRMYSQLKDEPTTPVMSEVYKSMLTLEVVGGSSVLLESPTPAAFSFAAKERKYQVDIDDICDEELSYGMEKETRNLRGRLNEKRLNRFIGGRVALRRALRAIESMECSTEYTDDGDNTLDKCSLVQEIGPILADSHGAPDLPVHVHGSISHKDNLGVGVAIIDSQGRVGCDIERCTNPNASMLSRRVLTEEERATLGPIRGSNDNIGLAVVEGDPEVSFHVGSAEEDVMLRFSFKEAVFKAIHPYLARSVDFDEVEVFPQEGGKAEVKFKLKQEQSSLRAEVSWHRYHHIREGEQMDYFVTYCHSHSPDGSADPYKSKR